MTRRVATLLVVAVVLAGLGIAAGMRVEALRSSESATNRAHVDVEATLDVRSAVARTVNRVLSYSHDDVEATERAAEDLLRGPARQEYRQLFAPVRDRAPAQRLTVTTRVTDSAVLSLTSETARVLVFLDQMAVRGDGEPTHAAAQLLVTADREDTRWVVTSLNPA
ncbi:hypothetical protein FFT09_16420 [Saccharomonospora piscinae]|uniref:hypothetical protein n=1 Tax=Saccharomonospora piscinae TaxID=687388 RepID=UPI0011071DB4|nr:hypothetical protein [Saccharomonospora piscinae]TLW90873.1 hypothetical protein FFT09_16420 [Saccharomonospora piscinae]